jgi:alpha-D-ribose 1-methylphosphonate 5-triphosphate synthase subunit PhnG
MMDTDPTTARRHWLAVLAQAPREALAGFAAALPDVPGEWLRDPETGLAMVRARMGNSGDRFNVGEATLTRCVFRVRDADGRSSAGVGYVVGRDAERARWVARIDALLQLPAYHDRLQRELIAPLQAATEAAHAAQRARTEASRVRFHTLQPEVSQ